MSNTDRRLKNVEVVLCQHILKSNLHFKDTWYMILRTWYLVHGTVVR